MAAITPILDEALRANAQIATELVELRALADAVVEALEPFTREHLEFGAEWDNQATLEIRKFNAPPNSPLPKVGLKPAHFREAARAYAALKDNRP